MDAKKREELMQIARRLEGIAMLVETLDDFSSLSEPIRAEVERIRRGVRQSSSNTTT